MKAAAAALEARTAAALLGQVVSIELRRTFAYRVEFWFRFLGVLLANVGVAYFLWKAIFLQSGATTVQGFTFAGMILYYVLVPLTENITRSTESGAISAEIYAGTLTRYLVYPMPFFVYKFGSTLGAGLIAAAQALLVLGLYGAVVGFPAEMPVTLSSVALGLGTAFVASLLNFVMVSAVEMVAFWADNIWTLNVMLVFTTRLLGGALLPLSLFPGRVQEVLQYTPFPYLVAFPVLTILGKIEPAAWGRGLAVLIAWTISFAVLTAVVWRRGNRRYTGVGA